MSKFLHDHNNNDATDDRAMTIPQSFFENSRAKNVQFSTKHSFFNLIYIPGKTLFKFLKKSNNFHSVPAVNTAGPCPTIISLLLLFYNNVQTEW